MGKYPGVMLYFDRLTFLERLNDAQAGQLFRAIVRYARDDLPPEWSDPSLALVWDFLRPALDQDKQRYAQICERNRRAVERRWAKRDTRVSDCIPNTTPKTNTTTYTNTYATTNTMQPRDDLALAERILAARRNGD